MLTVDRVKMIAAIDLCIFIFACVESFIATYSNLLKTKYQCHAEHSTDFHANKQRLIARLKRIFSQWALIDGYFVLLSFTKIGCLLKCGSHVSECQLGQIN